MKKLLTLSMAIATMFMVSCGQKSGLKLTDAEWQLKVTEEVVATPEAAPVAEEVVAAEVVATETVATTDTTITDSTAVVAEPMVKEVPTITFGLETADVFGMGLCNRYFGSYTAEGKNLSIEIKGSTMMACPWVEEETAYFEKLNSVKTYEIKDQELYLYDAEGNEVAVYVVKQLLNEEPATEEATVETTTVEEVVAEEPQAEAAATTEETK